jgi:sirohydrochlorin ferrochelatase
MDDGTYVRRRRWSAEEKRTVVAEALSSGNVIATNALHTLREAIRIGTEKRKTTVLCIDDMYSLRRITLPAPLAPDTPTRASREGRG